MGERGTHSFDLTEETERRLVYIAKCASWKVRWENFRIGIYDLNLPHFLNKNDILWYLYFMAQTPTLLGSTPSLL